MINIHIKEINVYMYIYIYIHSKHGTHIRWRHHVNKCLHNPIEQYLLLHTPLLHASPAGYIELYMTVKSKWFSRSFYKTSYWQQSRERNWRGVGM